MYSLFSQNRTRLNLGRRLNKLALPVVALVFAAAATNALASTLTLIPIPSTATYNGAIMPQAEARSITPDGKFVVGLCYVYSNMTYKPSYDQTWAFFYNATNNTSSRILAGSYASYAAGIGYRKSPNGSIETIVDGFGGGNKFAYKAIVASDGSVTWGTKWRCPTDYTQPGPWLATANSLGCKPTSDVFYTFIQGGYNSTETKSRVYPFSPSGLWPSGSTLFYPSNFFETMRFDCDVYMAGVSADGLEVGYYDSADGVGFPDYMNLHVNWAIGFLPPWMPDATHGWMYPNYTNCFTWAGLDGTWVGEAECITPDSTTIFGHSPKSSGTPFHAYKFVTNSITWDGLPITIPVCEGVLTELPSLPGVARAPGTTWAETPYGCSVDGRYAAGVSYVGTEKATLWDTGDADPNNWRVVDLTELAASEGILGNFVNLDRAYSVGVNADGYPVVAGYGKYTDGTTQTNRAFVMVVNPPPPRPQITSIEGAGTGTITVNYANTIAGKTYTLEYSTDLSNPAGWHAVGSGKTATGTTDFQTESSVSSAQRFYRLSYTP